MEKKLKRETQQKLDRAEPAEDPLLLATLEQKERLGNERACRELINIREGAQTNIFLISKSPSFMFANSASKRKVIKSRNKLALQSHF